MDDPATVKVTMAAKPLDVDAVVPPDHPLASRLIVRAKQRPYLFPAGTILSQVERYFVVRGWGAVFVFEAAEVTARYLSSADLVDIGSLPIEDDSVVLNAISDADPAAPRAADDVCPDCIFPVDVPVRPL